MQFARMTERRSWRKVGVVVALLCAAAAPAAAGAATTGKQAPKAAGSYQLTSSIYSVGPVKETDEIRGMCADGYHVDAKYERTIGAQRTDRLHSDAPMLVWTPQVTVHGKWIDVVHARGLDRNGTASNGSALYQGLSVQLYNESLISSHDGSFTWTCLPN
ncbi:MAG TPA: hypothetical protein VMA77_14590 [Solirubrobacteraceae bacterium]|nr:hypothetical protein [Solirubrobacteraceae bacterium]